LLPSFARRPRPSRGPDRNPLLEDCNPRLWTAQIGASETLISWIHPPQLQGMFFAGFFPVWICIGRFAGVSENGQATSRFWTDGIVGSFWGCINVVLPDSCAWVLASPPSHSHEWDIHTRSLRIVACPQ
jgi:hypothetical protein